MNTSETLEDIPLKKNEIMRLLNASKNSSFKTDDNSLISQRKTNFKRRSLIEIAEQTANKLKLDKEIVDKEKTIIEENKLEKVLNEEKKEETKVEKNKLEELEKKNKELIINIAEKDKIIDEKYLQGVSDGEKKINEKYEEKLNHALNALEQAKNLILGINSSQFIELREEMIKTIISLASERAGNEIKNLPEKFFEKIERLIEDIDQKTRAPKIFLNKEDSELIKKFMTENTEKKYNLIVDEKLISGEVVIEIGSIKVTDTFDNIINQNFQNEEKDLILNKNND